MSAKTYTTKEAIELMNNRKKVRKSNWATKGSHLYMDGYSIKNSKGITVFSNEESFLKTYSAQSDNWVEYIETISVEIILKPIILKPIIEKPCPCCKCHSEDEYNSKGKDGKWYCYKHCSY